METKGARTRQRIIDAALRLFTANGYHRTGINDILGATQLTKGGFYGHFPGKEALWYAVYDQAVAVWQTAVFQGIHPSLSPTERVRRLFTNHLYGYLGGEELGGGCFFVNMMGEVAGQSNPMRRHLMRGFIRFSQRIQQWLEEARSADQLAPEPPIEEIANFIIIALNGAAVLFIASQERRILDQTASQLNAYLSHLVKTD